MQCNILHTVLSRDNFCCQFTHFQVLHILASNCGCVQEDKNINVGGVWNMDQGLCEIHFSSFIAKAYLANVMALSLSTHFIIQPSM